MSSFTFLGREYKTDDFLKDTVNLSKQLALNARLEQPLTPGTDLTQAEQTEIQTQVHSIRSLCRLVGSSCLIHRTRDDYFRSVQS